MKRFMTLWAKHKWLMAPWSRRTYGVFAITFTTVACLTWSTLLFVDVVPRMQGLLPILYCLCAYQLGLSAFLVAHGRSHAERELNRGSVLFVITYLANAVWGGTLFPILAILIDPSGVTFFNLECENPKSSDFAWLAIDSFAKGGLVDFMESFNIDLFTCRPKKGSLVASSFVFGMRMYSALVFVWIIVSMWGRMKKRMAKALPGMPKVGG